MRAEHRELHMQHSPLYVHMRFYPVNAWMFLPAPLTDHDPGGCRIRVSRQGCSVPLTATRHACMTLLQAHRR